MICNRDCFNCPYSDCIVDDYTTEELQRSKREDERVIEYRGTLTKEEQKRIREQVRYYENREDRLEYQNKYNDVHAEQIREYQRRHYLATRERKIEAQRKYREEHREEIRARDRLRRRRKKMALKEECT